jgi:DNA-binding NtrC family response regulator
LTSVLLVDDDQTVCRMVERVLREEGYRVTALGNGRDALHELARSVPDLVITDWQMAGLNGDHVASAARELLPFVPIIVVTGFPGIAEAVANPNDHLLQVVPKPFALVDLIELVGWLTGHRAGAVTNA